MRFMLVVVLMGVCGVDRLVAQENEVKQEVLTTTEPESRMDQTWWKERHELRLREKESIEDLDILLLGDSITQGWETTGAAAWKKTFGDFDTFNLGFSGDRTEHVIWRLQNGEVDGLTPRVVMLLIGTNNTGHKLDPPEDIAAGIRVILNELKKRLPESKVLLLSVFPYDEDPDSPRRKNNNAVNEIIKDFGDGEQVIYLDICDSFFDESGKMTPEITPDFLHLSPGGYQLWAEAVQKKVRGLVGAGD